MKCRSCSVCCFTALTVSLSALAGIALFWAIILIAAVSKKPDIVASLNPQGFLDHLCDGWQYWYGFASAIFGAGFTLLGIFIGRRRRDREARAKLVERVRFNRERLIQIDEYFSQTIIPNFTLDTTGLVIWLHSASGILQEELIRDIDGHRYQLDHIANKLAMVYTFFSARCAATSGSPIPSQVFVESRDYANTLTVRIQIRDEIIRGDEIIKRIEGR